MNEPAVRLVATRSCGGVHDDAAFLAGWAMGALDRIFAFYAAAEMIPASLPEDILDQADLIAMRHGRVMTVTHRGAGYALVHFQTHPQESR